MIKKIFSNIFAFLKRKKGADVSTLLVRTYDNGRNAIPFIVFDKHLSYKKGYVYPSHYCNDSRLDIILDFCNRYGISVEKHGKLPKTNKDGITKEWNYVSLHVNGKYLSGQCFHRILTTAMEESGIVLKPKTK